MLFFFDYENKKSSSLSTWAIAKQCQAAAWFLIYFRGVMPDWLSIAAGSALLFAGIGLDAGAQWQAAGRDGWRRFMLPALGLLIAAFLVCYGIDLAPALRGAIGALIVATLILSGVLALAQEWSGATMLRRFLVVSMGLLAIAIAGRGLLALALPDGWTWISPAMMQAAGYGALYLVLLGNGLGYLLLSRQDLGRELARLAVVDALTDVPNRRGFYQALAPWMALARRPGMPTSLIVLKLDHFKRVNDGYGHPVGDVVLKTMVDVCKKQLRDSDLMGRLGGAEFAIQLPRTAPADALMVAERIRAAIAALPIKTERAVINLSASLGVTAIRADDSTVSLFQRADAALQAAKQGGRDRIVEAPAAVPLEP